MNSALQWVGVHNDIFHSLVNIVLLTFISRKIWNYINFILIEDCVETGDKGQVIQSIYDIVEKGYFACIKGHCNFCKSDEDCELV